jgi:diguanylate cyclase (GGDEF)-like protein
MTAAETQSVLVIDDSQDIHDLIDIRLKAESVTIVHALDADEGLAAARRHRPDLVLLDLDLAGKNGLEVCRAMKSEPDLAMIPVIFLTGTVDVEMKVQAFDAGAVDYVTKPFDAVELRARVRAALRMKRYQDLLATRAQLDALTGLWNRAYFDQLLTDEVAFFHRHGRHVALVMVDVDHFKRLNDTHGHPFGDTVLVKVADTLRRATRANENACRYGGEEFAIVLRETDLAGARATAERLRALITDIDVRRGNERIPVTASFGVASSETVANAGVVEAGELLKAADSALYEAKRSGRNCVCVGPGA